MLDGVVIPADVAKSAQAEEALKVVGKVSKLIEFHDRVNTNARKMIEPVDPEKLEPWLKFCVAVLYDKYTKDNNDIFAAIKSYVFENHMLFELIMLPVSEDLRACTFVRDKRMFMFINSNMPQEKQFFYAAYQMCRIFTYFNYPYGYMLDDGGWLSLSMDGVDMDNYASMFAEAFMEKVGSLDDTKQLSGNKTVWFGSLKENFEENIDMGILSEGRAVADKKCIEEIENMFTGGGGGMLIG